jgi:hypothetical protein
VSTFDEMMDRLAANTLGGSTAPLTVALTYWTREQFESGEDGTACRGIPFQDGKPLKDSEHGEWGNDTLYVHICNDASHNGLDDKPEKNGVIECRNKQYRVTHSVPSFGFWAVTAQRSERTQISHNIFQDTD